MPKNNNPTQKTEIQKALDRPLFKNPRWRPSMWYGPANFFPIGDKVIILFSIIGFSDIGIAMKSFSKWCARYLGSIRRFWPFSAGFNHFSQHFNSCGTYSQFVDTYHIFWGTGTDLYWYTFSKVDVYHIMHGNSPNIKHILKILPPYINWIRRFYCDFSILFHYQLRPVP